jgi:hypothetical protein
MIANPFMLFDGSIIKNKNQKYKLIKTD